MSAGSGRKIGYARVSDQVMELIPQHLHVAFEKGMYSGKTHLHRQDNRRNNERAGSANAWMN